MREPLASTPGEVPATGTIRGRIRPPNGRVPGPEALLASEVALEPIGKLGEVEADLHFELDGIPPASHALRVRVPGFVPIEREVDVRAGEVTHLDLELRTGVTLAGRVTHEDGRPAAGAFVDADSWLRDARGVHAHVGRRVEADSRGSFRIEGLPPGFVGVTASARDSVGGYEDLGPLQDGENREAIELSLSPGHVLRGRAMLGDGRPAAGARVSIEDESSDYWRGGFESSWDARCDEEGRFRAVVAPSESYRVRAWTPGEDVAGDPRTATLSHVSPDTAEVRLSLSPAGAVHLTVRGGTAARVQVLDPDGVATGGTPDTFFAEESRPTWVCETTAGGLVLRGLEPGERTVLVHSDSPPLAGWVRVLVEPGKTTRGEVTLLHATRLDLRVAHEPSLLIVSEEGLVLRVDGAFLRLRDEGEPLLLPQGRYLVTAVADGRRAEAEVVLSGEPRVSLALTLE